MQADKMPVRIIIQKIHTPPAQESGGGKHPPLAGHRKLRAGSLASKRRIRRIKSTFSVTVPALFIGHPRQGMDFSYFLSLDPFGCLGRD
jgi:hypothetical protein